MAEDRTTLPAQGRTRLPGTASPVRRFLAEARRYPRLTEEEERELGIRYREGGDIEAARKLVLHNLRLVAKIAFQYRQHWSGLQDLLQEGSLGLMKAVKKWDPDLGARFGSYGAYWIRAYILKFLLTNSRLMHVGNTRAGRKLFFQLEKERARLRAKGFDPTPALLAENLHMDEEKVRRVARHLDSHEVSMDARPAGDDGATLGERIAGGGADPEEAAARSELAENVSRVMARFAGELTDERERAVWTEHLTASEPASLSELGERFGVTKQRMGQIASKLKKEFRALLVEELGAEVEMAWID